MNSSPAEDLANDMAGGPANQLSDMLAELKADPDIIWAPIRHHSPTCAAMVAALIEQHRPDQVLIEGPSEANHLMDALAAADAKPPLALYLYAVGSKREGLDSPPRFRCFAPLAAMSPEWVAIRAAARIGSEARFIDLPYATRLDLPAFAEPQVSDHEPLLSDDALLARSDPTARLVARSSCRDFDEWWDRHFESGVWTADPHEYFDNMHRFCLYLRTAGQQSDPETDAREAFMAAQIASHRKAGQRVLAVTGGFHPLGIVQHLHSSTRPKAVAKGVKADVHLVPYSLDRLDRANGYAAGIPNAGYYDAVYRRMSRSPADAFRAANLDASTRLTSALRQRGYLATLPDTVELNVMAQRLAGLRGTRAGRPELIDAARSCLQKEARAGNSPFDAIVRDALQGDAVGSLPRQVTVAPLVTDLRQRCKRLRLPLRALAACRAESRYLSISAAS